MKKLALLLALAPLLAGAQTPPPPAGPMDPARVEKMQRHAVLAITLGMAEALQLDDAAALKLRGQLEKFGPRRMALVKQMHDSIQVLRRSAGGDKASTADVDGAISRLQDAQAQMLGLNRELVATVTKDLPPEKRAKAVLVLAKFQQRMMERMRPGARGRGPGAPGGPGGPGRPGMGPGVGPMGMNGDTEWDDGFGDS